MEHSEHHGHEHIHSHVHDPKEKRRQINRLSRVIGHLEYVKKMIDNDADCCYQVSVERPRKRNH